MLPQLHPLERIFPVIAAEVKRGNTSKLIDFMKTVIFIGDLQITKTHPKLCAKFVPLLEITMDRNEDLLPLISKVVDQFRKSGILALDEAKGEDVKSVAITGTNGTVVFNPSIYRLSNAFYRKSLKPENHQMSSQYSEAALRMEKKWFTRGFQDINFESITLAAEVHKLARDIDDLLLEAEMIKTLDYQASFIKEEKQLIEFAQALKEYHVLTDLLQTAVKNFLTAKNMPLASNLLLEFEDLVSFDNTEVREILMENVSVCISSEASMEGSLMHLLDPASFKGIRSITYILPPNVPQKFKQIFFDKCLEHEVMISTKLPLLETIAVVIPEPTVGRKLDSATLLKEAQCEYPQSYYQHSEGILLKYFTAIMDSERMVPDSFKQLGTILINLEGKMIFKSLQE